LVISDEPKNDFTELQEINLEKNNLYPIDKSCWC
jgi:hypothetical protein